MQEALSLATPENQIALFQTQPRWAVGTRLDLSRLSPRLRKSLANEVRRQILQEHRETLLLSRRNRLGQMPTYPRVKANLKRGVELTFALMETPDRVFIAGAAPCHPGKGYVTQLAYLEGLGPACMYFGYYLTFVKRIEGKDYVYTYGRPLLLEEYVEDCVIHDV